MATRKQFQQTTKQRQYRYFSEEFKKQKVRDIENNLTGVSELCREYEVTRSAVYKWIYNTEAKPSIADGTALFGRYE